MHRTRRRCTRTLAVALAWAACLLAGGSVARADDAGSAAISVAVKNGEVAGGPQVYRLKRDDAVTLKVVSDRAAELHVHGYDLQVKLQPNQPQTVKFFARRTGRFTIELHPGDAEVGVLEIYPR
jgi:hypothetical protein